MRLLALAHSCLKVLGTHDEYLASAMASKAPKFFRSVLVFHCLYKYKQYVYYFLICLWSNETHPILKKKLWHCTVCYSFSPFIDMLEMLCSNRELAPLVDRSWKMEIGGVLKEEPLPAC